MLCVDHSGAGRRDKRVLGHCLLVAAAVAGAAFAFAGTAAADIGNVGVQWLNAPPITVESDGGKYTEVVNSAAPIQGSMMVGIDAGASGRVKSWEGWPMLGLGEHAWENFWDYGYTESYGLPRPKVVSTAFPFSIPRSAYANFMVSACNSHADALRSQGRSNSEIFGQDRQYQIAVHGGLEYENSGIAGTPLPQEVRGWESYRKVTLICQRDDGLDPPAASVVSQAILVAQAARGTTGGGKCELQLSGSIIGETPNLDVTFVYVDDKGKQSDLKKVTTEADGDIGFKHDYPLSDGIESGKIRIVGQSHPFTSNWAAFESDCVGPAQDVATVLPPKAESLKFFEHDVVMHRGLLCPAQIVVVGTLKGRGKLTGGVALLAAGLPKALAQYSIENDEEFHIEGEHTLSWGPTQAQQTVKFAMNVTNTSGAIVEQLEKTEHFACRAVAPGSDAAVGGGSVGKAVPTQSQQATAPARLMLPQALVIQAPQGLVRDGRIRLAGAAPDAVHTLKFLRKNGGAYTAVNAAQLPKQMKGPIASFPLAALTGGRDWRLEVCPAKQDGTACRTSDFRLSRIGGALGGKTPDQPAGTPFVIAPGAIQ
jgi:hypothetical protein